MNTTEHKLIELLSNSIRTTETLSINPNTLKLESLFKEASFHKIDSLIYSSLDKTLFTKPNDLNILNTQKKIAINTIISQANHIKKTSNILQKFNDNNIPVILLKGLVVRYLYPEPNLRTMCDADILVHTHDLRKVESLLISLNYIKIEESDEHGAHLVFYNNNHVIEVHWRLTNKDYYKGNTSFEDNLWADAKVFNFEGVKVLSLSLEDLALHLCIHMAVHLACHGFGIRQLCDLVLVVEKQGHLINWNLFLEKAKLSGLEKFTLIIFKICNILFNMPIPKELHKAEEIKGKYINIFIDDIFNNGISGKKDESNIFAKEIAFDSDSNNNSVSKKFLALLFPPISQMNEKYNYAKKYKILLPIAWIHHLFEGINNKDYSLISKIKILTNTIFIAKKRQNLLNWLEI